MRRQGKARGEGDGLGRESNGGNDREFRITQADLHSHLWARMQQRGVRREEIERTLNRGWEAPDAKLGTRGRVMVFAYGAEWEGRFYQEKEVTVYCVLQDDR